MKTTAPKTTRPASAKQRAHREGFGLIAKLASYLKVAHEIGLHKETLRQKDDNPKYTTFSCFKHLNGGCYNDRGIDYSHVVVSKGPLTPPDITSVLLEGDGTLTLTLGKLYYNGDPDDKLLLVVYSSLLHASLLVDLGSRSAETLSTQLPTEWLAGHRASGIHLYAFFVGKKRFASNSVYLPLGDLPADPINGFSDPIKSEIDPINTPVDPIKENCDPIKSDPINSDPLTGRLYRAILKDGTLNYAGYAKLLGISEATVKRRLASLKAQGLILRTGSNKTGHWQLPS